MDGKPSEIIDIGASKGIIQQAVISGSEKPVLPLINRFNPLKKENARSVLNEMSELQINQLNGKSAIELPKQNQPGASTSGEQTPKPASNSPGAETTTPEPPKQPTPEEQNRLIEERRKEVVALLQEIGKILLDMKDSRILLVATALRAGDSPLADQFREATLFTFADFIPDVNKARIQAISDTKQLFKDSPFANLLRRQGNHDLASSLSEARPDQVFSTIENTLTQKEHDGSLTQFSQNIWKEMSGTDGASIVAHTPADITSALGMSQEDAPGYQRIVSDILNTIRICEASQARQKFYIGIKNKLLSVESISIASLVFGMVVQTIQQETGNNK